MHRLPSWLYSAIMVAAVSICTSACASDGVTRSVDTGVSGLWVLANISYAGMRAQGNPNGVWRVLAFIFGLPGTFLSWIVVAEGRQRAYGVDLPRNDRTF